MRVAASTYPIETPVSFEAYAQKQARWVEAAAEQRAQLLLFPEYATVELTSVLPAAMRGTLAQELEGLQAHLPALLDTFSALARKHQVYILGPSFPERDAASGRYYNRVRLHAPSGELATTDKLQMTCFESDDWGISPGPEQRVFETSLGVLGVAICYDSEFPLFVRRQVDLGAGLILVPSCTDTLAGYHRVSLSCRARALENQCYVLHASTAGAVPGSLTLDQNRGAAGIYGPVDVGFADDGVIARGALDTPGWVMADLDLAALARVREAGQVRNHRDWSTPGHLSGSVQRIKV